ncbi:MAG: PQQ-binding-like beta-propeller repeat protein [Clostridia bacterium]
MLTVVRRSKFWLFVLTVVFIRLWIIETPAVQAAEAPLLEWEKTIKNGQFNDLQQTADGGFIMVGEDFVPIRSESILIRKLDSQGEVEWESKLDEKNIAGDRIKQTIDGGYIVLGRSMIVNGVGTKDTYVFKLDSAGNLLWKRSFISIGWGRSVIETKDQEYVVMGDNRETKENKVFLFKLDSRGDEQWRIVKANSENEYRYFIHAARDEGFFLVGKRRDLKEEKDYVYLSKMDGTGTEQSEKIFKTDFDRINMINVMNDGGYVVSGSINSKKHLRKFDVDGNIQWETVLDGEPVGLSQIQRMTDGSYIATGGGGYENRIRGIYVIKLDANGKKEWEKYFGREDVGGEFVYQTADEGFIVWGHNDIKSRVILAKIKSEDIQEERVSKLVVSERKLSLRPENEVSVFATLLYKDESSGDVTNEVEWSSSKTKVATVTEGKITAVGPGKATVTAKYQTKKASFPITVAGSEKSFDLGRGYKNGGYDKYADQPSTVNWKNESRFTGSDNPFIRWTYYALEPHDPRESSIVPVIDRTGSVIIGMGNRLMAFNNLGVLKWEYPVGQVIHTNPVIGKDGSIYFGTSNTLFALSSEGEKKWALDFDGDPYTVISPFIGGDGTIHLKNPDGKHVAVSADGEIVWEREYGERQLSSTPVIGRDGTIYMTTIDSVFAADARGRIKWEVSLDPESGYDEIHRSPVIGDDGTIFYTSWHSVGAITPDGKLVWQNENEDEILTSVALSKEGTLYYATFESFKAVNKDGSPKWSLKIKHYSSSAPTPLVDKDGTVYITDGSAYMCALTVDGKIKWKAYAPGYPKGIALSADGTIYSGDGDRLYATGNGKEREVRALLFEDSNYNKTVPVGDRIEESVQIEYDDISRLDITNKIKWKTSNPAVVSVENGELRAVGEGEAEITAIYKNLKKTKKVKVVSKK